MYFKGLGRCCVRLRTCKGLVGVLLISRLHPGSAGIIVVACSLLVSGVLIIGFACNSHGLGAVSCSCVYVQDLGGVFDVFSVDLSYSLLEDYNHGSVLYSLLEICTQGLD